MPARKATPPAAIVIPGLLGISSLPGHAGDVAGRTAGNMMGDRELAALSRMAEGVNAGDARHYAGVYAEAAVITIFGGEKLEGRSAIEAYELQLLNQFPGTRFVFCSIWQKGDRVIASYAVNSPGPNGRSTGHEGLLFFRFGPDGRISEEHRYLDSFTPMAQMGIAGNNPPRPLPSLPPAPKIYRVEGSETGKIDTAIALACLRSIDSGKRQAFLATLDDDITIDELVDSHPCVGKEAAGGWLSKWSAQASDLASTITSIQEAGGFVLVESEPHGTLHGSLGPVSASGKPFVAHCGLILGVRNGKVNLIRIFMNAKEVAEAVGEWPPKNH
jgi:ketosteroid isomerase-like protein